MTLEDGRMLTGAKRYDTLQKTHSKEEFEKLKLVRVHPAFRVIALGLPVSINLFAYLFIYLSFIVNLLFSYVIIYLPQIFSHLFIYYLLRYYLLGFFSFNQPRYLGFRETIWILLFVHDFKH